MRNPSPDSLERCCASKGIWWGLPFMNWHHRDMCMCAWMLQLCLTLQPHGPARLLCPWGSPGKNTWVGCHALLHGIPPTQGFNPHLLCLLHCRQILYPLSYLGYTAVFKMDNQQGNPTTTKDNQQGGSCATGKHRELCTILCNNLMGKEFEKE